MTFRRVSGVWAVCLAVLLGVLSGCAGREFAPKKQIWY
jgi:hypothetical protein